MNKSDFVT